MVLSALIGEQAHDRSRLRCWRRARRHPSVLHVRDPGACGASWVRRRRRSRIGWRRWGARLQTQSYPVGNDGSDGECGQVVSGELVVSGCDTPEILQTAEDGLDHPSEFIAILIETNLALARFPTRNHRLCSFVADRLPQLIGIIALVSQDVGSKLVGHVGPFRQTATGARAVRIEYFPMVRRATALDYGPIR